jgi:hypothetical protein
MGKKGVGWGKNEQGAAMRCERLLELRRRHGRSTASMLAAVKQGGRRPAHRPRGEGHRRAGLGGRRPDVGKDPAAAPWSRGKWRGAPACCSPWGERAELLAAAVGRKSPCCRTP